MRPASIPTTPLTKSVDYKGQTPDVPYAPIMAREQNERVTGRVGAAGAGRGWGFDQRTDK